MVGVIFNINKALLAKSFNNIVPNRIKNYFGAVLNLSLHEVGTRKQSPKQEVIQTKKV